MFRKPSWTDAPFAFRTSAALARIPTRHSLDGTTTCRDDLTDRPNQKRLADFTYIWAAEGWLYVAVVLDLVSRRVVGWSVKAERAASRVMNALMMAVWRRGKADALLHPSDWDRTTHPSSFNGFWPTTGSPAR